MDHEDRSFIGVMIFIGCTCACLAAGIQFGPVIGLSTASIICFYFAIALIIKGKSK